MKLSSTLAILAGAGSVAPSLVHAFVAPSAFNGAALARTQGAQQRTGSQYGGGCQQQQQQQYQQHHPELVVCMSAGGRMPFIAGNWKMNPLSLDEAKVLSKKVAEQTQGSKDVEVAVIPPHPFLVPAKEQIASVDGSHVTVGAQNLYIENQGAFTGAVSTAMLASVGCTYVLCGHSERRTVFKDSDETVCRKVRKVLDNGLKPILCVGESKEEYESGLNKEICSVQLGKDLAGVTADEMANVVIAYEPVWAIGTGLTATPEVAQSVHAFIRSCLAQKYGDAVASGVRIQYGGSVTPETVDELMACPDIDGALVGGASLVAEKFARIVGFKSTVSA